MTRDDATTILEQEQPAAAENPEGRERRRATPEKASVSDPAGAFASVRTGSEAKGTPGAVPNLDILLDVDLRVTVELGRARMKFREALDLAPGSIIELNKQISEPVDILVNGALLATGEVVVTDDHFAVRVNKLLNRVDRIRRVV
jgi:flagellar motor switch protein FliN/FliY